MVKVQVKEPNGKEVVFYMDGILKEQLDRHVIKNLKKKDKDWVIVVDGEEGVGKSVFAMQLGKYIDPSLCLERVCFNAEEFKNAIIKAQPQQCVIFDEAFTGLASRTALSEINHLLVSLMMQMRQKNLAVIVVLPTFFLLDKYVALWRARGLFHVYEKSGSRGRWIYFNREKKKRMYLLGKKTYSYIGAKSKRKGRFTAKYVLDEQKYRKSKKEALEKRIFRERESKYLLQRDVTLLFLLNVKKVKRREIIDYYKGYGINMTADNLSVIRGKYRDIHPIPPNS